MNDAAIMTDRGLDGGADEKSSLARYSAALAAMILVLVISGCAFLYFQESRALSKLAPQAGNVASSNQGASEAALLRQFNRWVLWVAAGTAGGTSGFLLAVVAGLGYWRRTGVRRRVAREEAWRKATALLESQVADARKSEEQSQGLRTEDQKRTAALEYRNSQLQGELDSLKRAGKTLAQQQQALTSSKTVLELHVQARTKELQKLQRRDELILNSAGEGICGLDGTGKSTFVNPAVAKLTGWGLEELIGKTEQEIFGRPSANGGTAPAEQVSGEQVFCRKDGTSFPVEFVKTPISENGRVVGAVLVFKDITERKRVEETLEQKAVELARSNAELEQFAFVASHDLQEPLRKIQAFGDRLKTKCNGTMAPETHDYLERMQNAAARMRTLINDLLAFSRVIRSSEPFAPVDLGAAAKEVMGDLEVAIEKNGARVEVGELPTIEADPMQMRQLLLNLISNGLKFQPPGAVPVVKVQAHLTDLASAANKGFSKRRAAMEEPGQPPEKVCELSVQDNGIGFDEKYTERIFAVFQRLNGRTEYEGTGVGLAVCRRITDRHGGTIIARSTPGNGSTFIVTLPLTQPKPKPSQ